MKERESEREGARTEEARSEDIREGGRARERKKVPYEEKEREKEGMSARDRKASTYLTVISIRQLLHK